MSIPRNIMVEQSNAAPMEQQPFELVERKGVGHPDTICDSIMETVCIDLCHHYFERFGHICHHNIDKGLLVAGRSLPKIGGGMIIEPMKLIFGDRATYRCNAQIVPVGEIAEAAAKRWIRKHLRFVDPEQHLIFQNEIKPGSPELTDAFARKVIGANDTSAGVGYTPLSETELLVLAVERFLNSPELKARHPEAGEDIKIMGCRHRGHLTLTVALAFIDRFVSGTDHYFDRKAALRQEIMTFMADRSHRFDLVTVDINTLDDPARDESGMYLTVLGTSAEGGDGGQVGRGNRVNGIIPFNRPQTTEAAAGKNPVNHVGKIYNIFSHQIAGKIHRELDGVRAVTLSLCSQIGHPIDRPLAASAQLSFEADTNTERLKQQAAVIIDRELADIDTFCRHLAEGKFPVC
jgi:S-adenosylmethionine synthetase